mgnify:FL=1|jgi:hypothetical protein
MKKSILLILLFVISCSSGESNSTTPDTTSTTLATTSTTKVSNTRLLNISVYDDSTTDSYYLIKVAVDSPTYKKSWEPDLEFGSDKLNLPPIEIGEIGTIVLTFDSSSISIPLCFSPTIDSKGDLGSIWIVLNDKDIEIDGLPIQDVVINRSDQYVMKLKDNSKPNC